MKAQLEWRLLWTLSLSSPAVASVAATPEFIPAIYINYQRSPMSATELEKINEAHIDQLLKDLHQTVPAYREWLQRGVVNENPNSQSAARLHRLADNNIHFTREQVGSLVRGLNHPDGSVANDVRTTLVQILGLSFMEGEDWVHKAEYVRKPYIEAWTKFWQQNRSRYGRDLPWIVNDLGLDARILARGGSQLLSLTITNAGQVPWTLHTEVSGALTNGNGLTSPGVYEWPITLFVDEIERHPVRPAAYVVAGSARVMTPQETKALPDRSAHLGRVTIAPGQIYSYVMKMSEAFPDVDLQGATNLVARYSYGLYGTHKGESLWRGELRAKVE